MSTLHHENTDGILCPNFLLKSFNYDPDSSNSHKLVFTQRSVLLLFCWQGRCVCSNSQLKSHVEFNNAEHNILSTPKGTLTFTVDMEGSSCTILCLSLDFFMRYAPTNYSSSCTEKRGDLSKLFATNLYLRPKLRTIVEEIVTCAFEGHLKLLFTKAKVIELLSLQFSQYEEPARCNIALNTVEIEKMISVKHLIEQHFDQTHSIAALARKVGTNEQYLKRHFKMLFGNTVFGHILSCRMQKAKSLLVSGNYKVAEIAEKVGYKHATHFTSAFKKFFGYLPQTLKTRLS
jgi:AraC-like DNA-binding protein